MHPIVYLLPSPLCGHLTAIGVCIFVYINRKLNPNRVDICLGGGDIDSIIHLQCHIPKRIKDDSIKFGTFWGLLDQLGSRLLESAWGCFMAPTDTLTFPLFQMQTKLNRVAAVTRPWDHSLDLIQFCKHVQEHSRLPEGYATPWAAKPPPQLLLLCHVLSPKTLKWERTGY